MPLDPFLAGRLHVLADLRLEQFGDPEVFARWLEFHEDPGEWVVPDIGIEDVAIDGPHGAIPVRLYRPRSTPSAAVLWVHGGGFAGGTLDMAEAHVVAAELCSRSDALVASVDYRLAMDGIRYPVPLDDVQAAWRWLTSEHGGTVELLGLGGASAGAALALGTAVRERDAGTRQADVLLLGYPFAHFPNPMLDDQLVAEMMPLPPMMRFSVAQVEGMVRNYVGRITDLPADALPGAAALHDLPRTRVIISEYDDLRGSAELLVRQLVESGVDASSYLAVGMPHGHLNRTPALAEVDRSLDYFADALTLGTSNMTR